MAAHEVGQHVHLAEDAHPQRLWDMRMAHEGPVAGGDLALAAKFVPQRGQLRLAGRGPDPPNAAAERLVQALGDQPPQTPDCAAPLTSRLCR